MFFCLQHAKSRRGGQRKYAVGSKFSYMPIRYWCIQVSVLLQVCVNDPVTMIGCVCCPYLTTRTILISCPRAGFRQSAEVESIQEAFAVISL